MVVYASTTTLFLASRPVLRCEERELVLRLGQDLQEAAILPDDHFVTTGEAAVTTSGSMNLHGGIPTVNIAEMKIVKAQSKDRADGYID